MMWWMVLAGWPTAAMLAAVVGGKLIKEGSR